MDAANSPYFKQRGRVAEAEAKRIIARLFSEWLVVDAQVDDRADLDGADFVVQLPAVTFIVEFKPVATAATVRRAAERLTKHAHSDMVPVLAVPFMGEVGRRICAELGLGWIDLSGNADIRASTLRILIDGRPNQYVQLGRPATPFAPKSSRIARHLLANPNKSFTQRELATATDLDRGQVSRLVARLGEERLIKTVAKRVALGDRRGMLEAWRADYDFGRHGILRGHMLGRTGEEVIRRLARELDAKGKPYGFTGLAAAWALTHVASFRLVTVYVDALPDMRWQRTIDFMEQPMGTNVWFVQPEDDRILRSIRHADGIACVQPEQVWLDLKTHPERAPEAADALLERIIKGEFDG